MLLTTVQAMMKIQLPPWIRIVWHMGVEQSTQLEGWLQLLRCKWIPWKSSHVWIVPGDDDDVWSLTRGAYLRAVSNLVVKSVDAVHLPSVRIAREMVPHLLTKGALDAHVPALVGSSHWIGHHELWSCMVRAPRWRREVLRVARLGNSFEADLNLIKGLKFTQELPECYRCPKTGEQITCWNYAFVNGSMERNWVKSKVLPKTCWFERWLREAEGDEREEGGQGAEATAAESGAEAKAEEEGVEAKAEEELDLEVKVAEEGAEATAAESDVEATAAESGVEAKDAESDVEATAEEEGVEAKDAESDVEAKDAESDVEATAAEPGAEATAAESGAEAKDAESDDEESDEYVSGWWILVYLMACTCHSDFGYASTHGVTSQCILFQATNNAIKAPSMPCMCGLDGYFVHCFVLKSMPLEPCQLTWNCTEDPTSDPPLHPNLSRAEAFLYRGPTWTLTTNLPPSIVKRQHKSDFMQQVQHLRDLRLVLDGGEGD